VPINNQDGFKRWQGYMDFKSTKEAFLKFHLPLLVAFICIVSAAVASILLSRHSLLACLMISACLWLGCLLFLRLGFIGKRDGYIRQFGKAAYKIAAYRFLLPYGVFWLAAVTMPLWAPGERVLKLFPSSILSLAIIVATIFLMHKILIAFGMDRLIYLYTYFPQDATLVKLKIFEFIRHPAYAAWVYFGIGFFLIRGSFASLLCLVINFVAISIIIKAEEGDIIRDFKEDYRVYQGSVPCFFPKRPLAFVKFLFK